MITITITIEQLSKECLGMLSVDVPDSATAAEQELATIVAGAATAALGLCDPCPAMSN